MSVFKRLLLERSLSLRAWLWPPAPLHTRTILPTVNLVKSLKANPAELG